ncbi:unnamed protein product [Choristocarpus tenellus]
MQGWMRGKASRPLIAGDISTWKEKVIRRCKAQESGTLKAGVARKADQGQDTADVLIFIVQSRRMWQRQRGSMSGSSEGEKALYLVTVAISYGVVGECWCGSGKMHLHYRPNAYNHITQKSRHGKMGPKWTATTPHPQIL